MDLQKITDQLQANLTASGGFEGIVKLKIENGATILIDNLTVSNESKDADCDIVLNEETFLELVSGELNATAAFMAGRMKIEGNMGLAMKLAPVLSNK